MRVSRRVWRRRYKQYLASPVWARKVARVHARSNGRCEQRGCRSRGHDVHHIRYPIVLGTEPITWLVHLCRRHHCQAHGLGPINFLSDLAEVAALVIIAAWLIRGLRGL